MLTFVDVNMALALAEAGLAGLCAALLVSLPWSGGGHE